MNFTKLLNRGKRKFKDKYLKKRNIGHCEGCKKMRLLISYTEPSIIIDELLLCESCYEEIVNSEK